MVEREGEGQIEKMQEQKEYSFEEGVEETLKRIDSLLEKQDYVVVAISGDTNVGKTTFLNEVGKEIMLRNIPHVIESNVDDISELTRKQVEREKKFRKSKKCVIVLEGANFPVSKMTEEQIGMFKENIDKNLSFKANKVGLSLSKVDLRIHLYRLDKPFSTNESINQFADIIINNIYAKDDERKKKY